MDAQYGLRSKRCRGHAMSAQNTFNQVERLRSECYSGCHIWLGQHHQHRSCSPIRIIRPRRQIQSWCSSVQHPYCLLRIRRWTSPDPSSRRSRGRPRTTWLDYISSSKCLAYFEGLNRVVGSRIEYKNGIYNTASITRKLLISEWLWGRFVVLYSNSFFV